MGFGNKKNVGSVYSVSPLSRNEATKPTPREGEFDHSLSDLEKKDLAYKRRIRLLRLISRFGSLILNGYMLGTLSFSLAKYFLTKNKIISGNVHPWANPTKLWPTIMLLAIATVTFLMNFITLCAYLCGVGAANKTNSIFSIVGYIMLAAHVVVWAVSAGAFKMARDGHDLWGWSCSPNADAIQEEVQAFMDFGKLCTIQTGAWYTSIIEAAVYFVTFLAVILMVRRAAHKKKINRVKSTISMDTGHGQNVELGTSYQPATGKRYMPVSVESPHF